MSIVLLVYLISTIVILTFAHIVETAVRTLDLPQDSGLELEINNSRWEITIFAIVPLVQYGLALFYVAKLVVYFGVKVYGK